MHFSIHKIARLLNFYFHSTWLRIFLGFFCANLGSMIAWRFLPRPSGPQPSVICPLNNNDVSDNFKIDRSAAMPKFLKNLFMELQFKNYSVRSELSKITNMNSSSMQRSSSCSIFCVHLLHIPDQTYSGFVLLVTSTALWVNEENFERKRGVERLQRQIHN